MSQPSAFGVGDMVRHARFGAGEVVAVGGGTIIIRFPDHGDKVFVPEIAPLTKVAEAGEDEITASRKNENTEAYTAGLRAADTIGLDIAVVMNRVRESEHATDASLIELARIIEETGQGETRVDVMNAEYFFDLMLENGIHAVRERVAEMQAAMEEMQKQGEDAAEEEEDDGGWMSVEKTRFTPWRENGYMAHGAAQEAYANSLDKAHGIPFEDFVHSFDFGVWRDRTQREHIAAARARDLYSLASPSLFVWKRIGGRSMAHIENMGRRFTSRAWLDNLPLTNVERGGALRTKPDPGYRQFLKDWQTIQWAREDLYQEPDEWGGGEDVPLRAILGGIQDFTPWRENEDPEDWDDYVRELKKKTHKRPKGYAAWRPQKKTARLIMKVKEILKEYEDHLPLTNRQIFYRLVAAYGYPKTEDFAKSLNDHLTRARRSKKIGFDVIRDDGISIMDHDHYADENAFYKAEHERANAYKRDKLARQGLDIRVYCEAAGMMPQLERVCEPYSIPVYSCSGFDSVSAKYELSTSCWQSFVYRGRRTVILHLGDHDPSGESIFNDGLVQDVHAFLAEDVPHKDPREVCDFERVALTQEQVLRFNLETTPPKDSDSRTANWTGSGACQLEALPPDTLAGLLENAIRRRLDMAIYTEDLKVEEEERRRITKALPAASENA